MLPLRYGFYRQPQTKIRTLNIKLPRRVTDRNLLPSRPVALFTIATDGAVLVLGPPAMRAYASACLTLRLTGQLRSSAATRHTSAGFETGAGDSSFRFHLSARLFSWTRVRIRPHPKEQSRRDGLAHAANEILGNHRRQARCCRVVVEFIAAPLRVTAGAGLSMRTKTTANATSSNLTSC